MSLDAKRRRGASPPNAGPLRKLLASLMPSRVLAPGPRWFDAAPAITAPTDAGGSRGSRAPSGRFRHGPASTARTGPAAKIRRCRPRTRPGPARSTGTLARCGEPQLRPPGARLGKSAGPAARSGTESRSAGSVSDGRKKHRAKLVLRRGGLAPAHGCPRHLALGPAVGRVPGSCDKAERGRQPPGDRVHRRSRRDHQLRPGRAGRGLAGRRPSAGPLRSCRAGA